MPVSVSFQHLLRSRLARLGLSMTLIALSGWAFLPYFAYRIAPSAFVNAELVRVTAPIPGRLSQMLPRKGDFVDQASTLKLVDTLSPDRRQLLDLERQHALAKQHARLAGQQLAEIGAADRELAQRSEAYRGGMINRLTSEREEAAAERIGCLAEAHQRREVGSRLEQLVRTGNVSQIRSAEALASVEATSTRCQMAESRVQRLEGELASAGKGVFLRDGANDVPYSQQQRDRLLLRRQELEMELLLESARSSQIEAEIAEERSRLDRVGHSEVSLPATHVIWSVAASPGSAVTEGQTILDLADCGHRFVAVELPERDFEKIKTGDPAAVRLIGSEDWMAGHVLQVRGSAARADDRLLAAQVPTPNSGSITVDVALPQGALLEDRNGFCNIGRLAEVRFRRAAWSITDNLTRPLQWLVARANGLSAPRVADK